MTVTITRVPSEFADWEKLLSVLHSAFAYMEGRIDPPSSLHRLNSKTIAEKSQGETLFIAMDDGELVGCVFAKAQPESLYVGKLAVTPGRQGKGTGRQLMAAAERYAAECGYNFMELETRIELVENHQTFAKLGYVKTAENSHAGFERPTSITMQKRLDAQTSNKRDEENQGQ